MDDSGADEQPPYQHTPAIFTSYKAAEHVILNNELDISEHGLNRYAIIEKTYLNQIYPKGENRVWFEWNFAEREYVISEIPLQFAGVASFGIS